LEEIEKEKARIRQLSGLKNVNEKGDTREIVTKKRNLTRNL
jgi:hypothetical protein